MSEQELEAAETPEVEIEPQEEPPKEPETQPDPELEAEARKYGWRPKEEYTKDPDGWVEPEKFMGFQSTQRKVLSDRLREVESNIDNMVSQRVGPIEQMLKSQYEAEQERQRQSYEQRIAELQAAQRTAVETADTDAFDQATQAIQKVQQPQSQQPPQENPVVADYRQKNDWTRDPVMWNVAVQAVENSKVLMSAEDQLRLGEHAVRREFPEKFEPPKPPKQKVDGGGLAANTTKAKGWADLPPEAKKQGKEFVSDGLFKDQEEYAKEYFSHLGE
ncbi:MAG: hypothetical protein AAF438_16965 [Pseudomonadota bacterium]